MKVVDKEQQARKLKSEAEAKALEAEKRMQSALEDLKTAQIAREEACREQAMCVTQKEM